MFRFDCNDKADEILTRGAREGSIRGMEKQDQVLLGLHGPVFLIRQGGEDVGVEISKSGPMSQWDELLDAAWQLVLDGLLKRGVNNGTPRVYYEFTERGKIAHWALMEARDMHRDGAAWRLS